MASSSSTSGEFYTPEPVAQQELPEDDTLKNSLIQATERVMLLQDGLPIDWLVRAHQVRNLETMVYLFELQEKWGNRNIKEIAFLLQEHEKSGHGVCSQFDPPKIDRVRRHDEEHKDDTRVFTFISRLMSLIQQETVIWDKYGNPYCGCHQKMRQAWSNISLKLGGWAAIQHVHFLKSIYRRKRDLYNTEYLRENKPFQYAEQMAFLKDVVEIGRSNSETSTVGIGAYMEAFYPELEYHVEVMDAPPDTRELLKNFESMAHQISDMYGKEALAEFLTRCANETIQLREEIACFGISGEEGANEEQEKRRNEVLVDQQDEDMDQEMEDQSSVI